MDEQQNIPEPQNLTPPLQEPPVVGKWHVTLLQKRILIYGGIISGILLIGLGITRYQMYTAYQRVTEEAAKAQKAAEELQKKRAEQDPTADWKTYRNEEYGFEFKYQNNLVLEGRVLGADSQYALNILLNNTGSNLSEFGASIFIKVASNASKSKFIDTCKDSAVCTPGERIYINSCEYHLNESEGNHTAKVDGHDMNYAIFSIDDIKACSQYYWRFGGESQSGKVVVAITPIGTRYEFIVPIGYGLSIEKALTLTDDSLKEWEDETNNAYFGEPQKGSSDNVNRLNQILSTFKFTK